MAKRRAMTESDDENASATASKRSRTADSEDEQDQPPRTQQRRGHGASRNTGKARAQANGASDVEDDDEDAAIQEPDEDEEKKFEEDNEEKIRERLMNKSKSQGGVAEMGIIESLEMTQFMCHKLLTFTFGPQINFIIGHNGSGKSAVLSALTVALGGKATSTGRGSGLKSFIREGQSVAEVTVVLKNQGEEAYRPKEYGKSIIITRRFTKDGSSSYKIKSKDNRVVSTKREELQAICDHMNIQVDNPMNILTQDSARQFLSASSPADKYKFFLKGTQLSQLSEEYQTCMENISQTAKVLKRKAEVIPDLQRAYEEVYARFEEAEKAREQRHKADELKKEMAWAHVEAKKAELHDELSKVGQIQRQIGKYEGKVKDAEGRRDECSNQITAVEEELEMLGNVDTLTGRQEDIKTKTREIKKKLGQLKSDESSINESLKGMNQNIADLEQKIKDEQSRLESHSREKRDKATAGLNAANQDLAEKERMLKDVVDQRQQAQAQADSAQAEGTRLQDERDSTRREIVGCDEQINRCTEMERSKFAQFGHGMDRVINQIRNSRWHGQPPVGPFGMYVKVNDDKWAPLLRIIIGGAMSSFAITDARDRPALAQILQQSGNRHAQIIIAEVDMFDFSGGEPPQQYLTVLRALEISDPYVLRQLVNTSHIESTLLAPTRAEADKMLMALGTGGQAMARDFYRVVRFPEGGGQSSVIPSLKKNDPRHLLFSKTNADGEKRRWSEQKEGLEAKCQEHDRRISELRWTVSEARKKVTQLQTQERWLGQQCRELKTKISNLQLELNEDLPVNIQALQDALDIANEEKVSITQQFEQLFREKQRLEDEQSPLLLELANIRDQINRFDAKRRDIQDRMSAAAEQRMTHLNSIEHFNKKVVDERERLQAAERVAATVQEEYTAWYQKASEYCEPYPNPRHVDVIDRALKAVQAALKNHENTQGATVNEIAEELQRKKLALDTAKGDIRALNSLNKALKRSVKARLARWHEFRRHIALRCKVYFGYHLSNRGYFGKVLFDHVNGKLDLKVQTDDQNLTQQNNREKDPRSLSGGEKSFSTICLLLSLWESIGCPIRCLDEFDVFMDAVNRRISMKMMIDTANASNRKQYILITPQDMTNINIGNTVRVHRMTDPERGQGVLAF